MNIIINNILNILISLWICIMVMKYQDISQKGTIWWVGFWVVFWLSIGMYDYIF